MTLRILLAHNHYQQPGGEDAVFAAESALLHGYGHSVTELREHNKRAQELSRIQLAVNTVWSWRSQGEVRRILQLTRPDVVHFHNTFMMLSPSVYYACKESGIPVVQTLHNYRLLCPSATMYRDGQVCEACAGQTFAWPGVRYGCYRGSSAATAVTASMLTFHRWIGTWTGAVDRYIALTEFARQKFIAGGLPAEKVVVKPNFLATDPGTGEHDGGYFLFVGRLSEEKGIHTLLDAWRALGAKVRLKIAGDGPLASEVAKAAAADPSIEWLGSRPTQDVMALMKGATALLCPSLWYEGFPMVIVEAFAVGLPVITSGIGGMAEVVADGQSGFHVSPGNPDELASKLEWALDNPDDMARMGRSARAEFEAKYTAEFNHKRLLEIYEAARGGGERS